jgi:transcription elongation factor Elf1
VAHLTADNSNVIAHRFAGDSLMYTCPDCAFGEVPVTALIEDGSARCLDCGSRFELHVEAVADDAGAAADV